MNNERFDEEQLILSNAVILIKRDVGSCETCDKD